MRLATPLRSEVEFDRVPTGDGGTGRPRSIRARVKISPVEAEAPFGELSASRGLRPLSSGLNSTSIDHAGSRKPGGAIVRWPSLTQAEARPRPWLASASPPRWNRSLVTCHLMGLFNNPTTRGADATSGTTGSTRRGRPRNEEARPGPGKRPARPRSGANVGPPTNGRRPTASADARTQVRRVAQRSTGDAAEPTTTGKPKTAQRTCES